MSGLNEVRFAWSTGDLRRVLLALLAEWRENRAPELADAIEHVSRLLLPAVPPLAAAGPTKAFEAWLARAKQGDPVDLCVLLPLMLDQNQSYSRKRLEALQSFEDDPRIARTITDYVLQWGRLLAGKPVGVVVFGVLARHCDERMLTALRNAPRLDFGPPHRSWSRRHFARIEKQLTPARPLDAQACALLAEIRAQPLDTERAERFATATDEAARAVAVDALLEAGDPRGEFVVLQQARRTRRLSPAERRREAELLAANRIAWMGALASVFDPAHALFEDGRFVGGEMFHTNDDLLLDAPEWRDVRVIEPGFRVLPALHRWPGIERVITSSGLLLAELASSVPPVAIKSLAYTSYDFSAREERAALSRAPGLPLLEELVLEARGLPGELLEQVLAGELGHRVRRLVFSPLMPLQDWVARIARAPTNIRRARLGNEGPWFELERDAAGEIIRAIVGFTTPRHDVRKQFDAWVTAIAAMPRGLVPRLELAPHVDGPGKAALAALQRVVEAHA